MCNQAATPHLQAQHPPIFAARDRGTEKTENEWANRERRGDVGDGCTVEVEDGVRVNDDVVKEARKAEMRDLSCACAWEGTCSA